MKFAKRSMALAVILSLYVLFFNYNMLDYIYITKQRKEISFPTGIRYREIVVPESRPLSRKKARPDVLGNKARASKIFKDLDQQPKGQATSETQTHSSAPSAIEMNSPNVAPFYETYEAMMKDDASNTRTYPAETKCPYLGLRKPFITSTERSRQRWNTTCRKKLQTSQDCKEAVEYYGTPGSQKARECPSTKAVILCTILKNRTEKQDFKVSCDDSQCDGKPIMVAMFDEGTGMIGEKWTVVPEPKFLGQLFRRYVSSSRFRSRFVWLKCEGNDAFQVLTLPKKRAKYRHRKRLNINIVIEDSLSRSHFYRTLSKTASTFRKIIHDESIPATVLDFEMFQSYASMTSGNLKRLFTGRKYVGSTTELTDSYGTEEFLSALKSEGYTTLFQEDNCWCDVWGVLLDPRQGGKKVLSKAERTQKWQSHIDFLETAHLNDVIDDFGLTFLTCSVYGHFNVTNIFNGRKFPKVCFNGRHSSSLFLEYVKDYAIANDESEQPFISYTHLITSHEGTGKRVVNDDATLADLFLSAAYLSNTVTIFASDHGGKSTAFSTYTTQGRHEVFQPLLFIILPHQVGKKLGVNILNSLVVNQKRLAGLEDIHYALLSLPDLSRVGTNTRPGGLFRSLPLNRTCDDIVLNSDALCLCEGMDKTVANNSFMVLWAAEYVLGTLNNRIQSQYVTSLKRAGHPTSDYNGYGACQRYTGVEIRRARHEIAGENQTLQFSLHVQPFHLKTIEVFDAQVTFPIHGENGIVLNNLVRVSMFNVYEQCADDGVDPTLCACHNDDSNITLWQNEFILNGHRRTSFSVEPRTSILDHPCLFIVSRSHQWFIQLRSWQDTVVTYEAINACALVTYELTIDIKKAVETRLSLTRPKKVTLFPRTMTFLMTAKNDWKYGRVVPKFTFEKITLK